MDETVTEVILGMAKGRVKFQTNSGRSGSGKRASSELDVLRLVYAAKTLRGRGLKVHAYFAVLRDYEGRSTKETVETWLKKYDGSDCVQIVERTLTQQETTDLEKEKQDNAAAQERRGGNAKAGLAEKFAEDYLREYIKKSHPTAQPGTTDLFRPFFLFSFSSIDKREELASAASASSVKATPSEKFSVLLLSFSLPIWNTKTEKLVDRGVGLDRSESI